MPLTPSFCASWPQPSRLCGSLISTPVSRAMSSSACLTNHDTMPGLAPQVETAVLLCELAVLMRIDDDKARLVIIEVAFDQGQRAFADRAEADHDNGAGNFRMDLRGRAHKWVSGKIRSVVKVGSGGAALRGHFDLDLHLGLVEARDDEKRSGGADVAEDLAANGEMGIRVRMVGDVIRRAPEVGQRETAFLPARLDGPAAVP